MGQGSGIPCHLWRKGRRLLKFLNRFGKGSVSQVGSAQLKMRKAKTGIQLHQLAQLLEGRILFPRLHQDKSNARVDVEGKRIKLLSCFYLGQGFVMSAV